METLSSRMMRKGDNRMDDNSVDELYDEKGFFFRQRRGHLNLRRLEGIDMERMIREVDIDMLQQNIEDITFCEFGENDVHFLTDRQVVKIFRLAQLTIEYLLYSQGKLVGNLSELSKKYNEKKRSLYRKRKELSGLKEEANSLYAQLKAKRRNLHTLEKILKDSNETAALNKPKGELQSTKPASPYLKFFVTFPDGLFVEFEELSDAPLRKLISLIQNIIANNYPKDAKENKEANNRYWDEMFGQIKLFLKGKMLLVEQNLTLEQCGIKSGDTLLVSLPKPPAPTEKIIVEKVPIVTEKPVSNPKDQKMLDGIMQAVGTQLDCIQKLTSEVNNWTSALQNMSKKQFEHFANNETQLVGQIDDRLKHIETEIKDNLGRVRELDEARNSLAKRPRNLIFGEIETDGDDNNQAIQEINQKLQQSGKKMDSLDNQIGQAATAINELKDIIKDQHVQVVELRHSLLDKLSQPMKYPEPIIIHQPAAPQSVPAPVIAPAAPVVHQETHHHLHVMKSEKHAPEVVENKWNHLAFMGQATAPVTPLVGEVNPISQDFATPAPIKPIPQATPVPQPKLEQLPPKSLPPTIVKPSVPTPTPVQQEEEIAEEIMELPTPLTSMAPKLEIVFPVSYYSNEVLELLKPQDILLHESLHRQSVSTIGLSPCKVLLANDLDTDDIVFQVRSTIASQLNVKLPAISLLLDGKKTIKLGVDVPKALLFTTESVAAYAHTGRLRIHPVNRISNTQIDMLVPAYEKLPSKSRNEAKVAINQKLQSQRRTFEDDEMKQQSSPQQPAEAKSSGRGGSSSSKSAKGEKPSQAPGPGQALGQPMDLSDSDSYQKVRQSFEGLLQQLDRKGSLSDQEVTQSRKQLDTYYASASTTGSGPEIEDGQQARAQMRQYKSSLAKAMNTITLLHGDNERMQQSTDSFVHRTSLDRSLDSESVRPGLRPGLLAASLSQSFVQQRGQRMAATPTTRRSMEQFQQERSWYDDLDDDVVNTGMSQSTTGTGITGTGNTGNKLMMISSMENPPTLSNTLSNNMSNTMSNTMSNNMSNNMSNTMSNNMSGTVRGVDKDSGKISFVSSLGSQEDDNDDDSALDGSAYSTTGIPPTATGNTTTGTGTVTGTAAKRAPTTSNTPSGFLRPKSLLQTSSDISQTSFDDHPILQTAPKTPFQLTGSMISDTGNSFMVQDGDTGNRITMNTMSTIGDTMNTGMDDEDEVTFTGPDTGPAFSSGKFSATQETGLSSTLTSSLPDGFNLSTTIDSEGDVFLQRNPHLGETSASDIRRRTDALERRVLRTALDDSPDASADETAESPTASPFKSFHDTPVAGRQLRGGEDAYQRRRGGNTGHNTSIHSLTDDNSVEMLDEVEGFSLMKKHSKTGLLEDDNSVHSLALSDSNNNFA